MTGTSAMTGTWVRRFEPAPDAPTRLVCFPHAGGSATYYYPVAKALAPSIETLAIQYPGRQDRRHEPCIDDIRVLADLVVDEIRDWADRPTALFGHSMGATLGFEVALRLQAIGVGPLVLFASGRRAPSTHRDETVHLLDDDGLVADLKRLSGTQSALLGDDEVIRMVLPSVRSDYRAAETYRWYGSDELRCPIVALTGDADPQVTLAEAEAWARHTTESFRLRVYDGGHFFLNDHAADVMREITTTIARLSAR
jgi:surfactin synthase thioesterase subunit